jgi:hypothetical protein
VLRDQGPYEAFSGARLEFLEALRESARELKLDVLEANNR